MNEPQLKIGIMYEPQIEFVLNGEYILKETGKSFRGKQVVNYKEKQIFLNDELFSGDKLLFEPLNYDRASFDLLDVTIGIKFHWERKEDQKFKGSLKFIIEDGKLTAINVLSLEDYLLSVISSEMSATSSLELLKAHAVISRSWLLAQVIKGKQLEQSHHSYQSISETTEEYIRWYDREDHTNFDVCADDHCQRYQGITRQTSQLVGKAIDETRGLCLMYNDNVCDARFYKSCGGITELFENTWEPVNHPYLQAIVDNSQIPATYDLDLTKEEAAQRWIRTSPKAFCNTNDVKVLSQVLNDYDQETTDFYRWEVTYSQEKIAELISRKTGKDFGHIIDLIPVERGKSGRLIRLKIVGSKLTLTIGKELQIRKVLSESHLYSSAFVVDRHKIADGIPGEFVLTGAGWGHGVGLCQIGAAMMGEKGYNFREILEQYFKGAELKNYY
ncbi:MAG TPA: SpoIID/LytB domain-containing protein [Bacteroidales bacterium]|nr:SpoIID/LytB domain-containing protein [Bacteroidales bacterium]